MKCRSSSMVSMYNIISSKFRLKAILLSIKHLKLYLVSRCIDTSLECLSTDKQSMLWATWVMSVVLWVCA